MPTPDILDESEYQPLAEQHVFDRFVQAARHIRAQYDMTISIHDAIVLDALLRHHTIRDAARELSITPHTLSNYQQALFKRFDCHNRQELRIYCQKRGWCNPITRVGAADTNALHLPRTTDY